MDHTAILGETLLEIATEKAGIIKKEVPVVIGDNEKEAADAIKVVAELNKSRVLETVNELRVSDYEVELGKFLPGKYQIENLKTALIALEFLLKDKNIKGDAVALALVNIKRNSGLRGRMDIISTSPSIIVDVAHNPDGIHSTLEYVRESNDGELHVVLGMLKDKDGETSIKKLPVNTRLYLTNLSTPRAYLSSELHGMAKANGIEHVNEYKTAAEALEGAKKNADAQDTILCIGSNYLAADIYQAELAL